MFLLSWLAGTLLLLGTGTTQAVETGFLDRSVLVDGVPYKFQVYVPRDNHGGLPIILFLHGAGRRGNDGITRA